MWFYTYTLSRGDVWRGLFHAAWWQSLDIHDLMLDRKVVPLWTVHTSVWTLQSDAVSTRQWPCCGMYTQHSVGSCALRLRLCVKELISLSGRSASLHLKSFSYVSMRSVALPAWLTARLPTCLVCLPLMMRMMRGIKEEMELTSGWSSPWDTRWLWRELWSNLLDGCPLM